MSARFQLSGLIFLLIFIPCLAWWIIPWVPSLRQTPEVFSGGTSYETTEVPFQKVTVGNDAVGLPIITNLQIEDFDGDGKNDILCCDASRNLISLMKYTDNETWEETTLIEDVAVPAHVTTVDIDGDNDRDVIVSILGNILPDDNVIGRVELFEALPDGTYKRHVILDDVRRVADVQPGDFDADGDIDLVVAVFGYNRGEIIWLENQGNFQFLDHQLLNAPGTIHVPVADYDGDGDLDIAAIVTQDEEELWGFENDGSGMFTAKLLWTTPNFDLGSAGLIKADLDGDGDQDLILPAGDNLEDLAAYPQPYHGCYWFENQGDWSFSMKRISDLGGTYAADVGDIDGDQDLDIVLVSMTNNWYEEDHASVVWLENDGKQNFKTWQIDQDPIHLVTVAVGDINSDGREDIIAGSLNLRSPFQRIGRVTGWLNPGKETP